MDFGLCIIKVSKNMPLYVLVRDKVQRRTERNGYPSFSKKRRGCNISISNSRKTIVWQVLVKTGRSKIIE